MISKSLLSLYFHFLLLSINPSLKSEVVLGVMAKAIELKVGVPLSKVQPQNIFFIVNDLLFSF